LPTWRERSIRKTGRRIRSKSAETNGQLCFWGPKKQLGRQKAEKGRGDLKAVVFGWKRRSDYKKKRMLKKGGKK